MRTFSSSVTVAITVALSTTLVSLASAYSDPFSRTHRRVAHGRQYQTFDIQLVLDNAKSISTRSWELGTLTEALTELEYPEYSVFAMDTVFSVLACDKLPHDVLDIASAVVAKKPANSSAFIVDGATGDPASLGVAVLLANWTLPDADLDYDGAVTEQLNHLLYEVPRAANGAISHREEETALWADFVYMAPPFIAFYGAVHGGANGSALLHEAYDQCRLYREVLYDADVQLWKHILLGSWDDTNHWGTGNAWAAAGMMRVLATLQSSKEGKKMVLQQEDLTSWIDEILTGAWNYQQSNGILLNYIDKSDSFADTSSTALLAATSYRLATLTGIDTHIDAAERAYALIVSEVDDQGWLHNTVDPESFSTPSVKGTYSPEGQSFVVLLQAARDAYYEAAQ